jgi:hypothetical protein
MKSHALNGKNKKPGCRKNLREGETGIDNIMNHDDERKHKL